MIENLKELLLEAQSIENDKADLLKMKRDLEARERLCQEDGRDG